MEPRSAERGNFDERGQQMFLCHELQWSHAQPNVETQGCRRSASSAYRASMEPRSAERGNRDTNDSKALLRACFNGATLSRTWKHIIEHALLRVTMASMEPRSAERGNHSNCGHKDSPFIASMEPRSAERGNNNDYRKGTERNRASMEPRSAERGN